jgi:aminomuconate-semialdehyde/2-hydroxymuconate-6-semialdehyde dehydrogenase
MENGQKQRVKSISSIRNPQQTKFFHIFHVHLVRSIHIVSPCEEEDVKEAVEGAKNAHKKRVWSGLTEEARAAFLDKIANKIEERFEEFAKLESEDCGKPISTARMIDIDRAVKNFRFFAGALRHEETSCHTISNTVVSYTLRRPVGIAGLITPWNLRMFVFHH